MCVNPENFVDKCNPNDDGCFDEVGGYHSEVIGWNPHGIWHGECTRASCKGCPYEHETIDPLQGELISHENE